METINSFKNDKGICVFLKRKSYGSCEAFGEIHVLLMQSIDFGNFSLDEAILEDGSLFEDDIRIEGYKENSLWIAASFDTNTLEYSVDFNIRLWRKIGDGRSKQYEEDTDNMQLYWDCIIECLSE